MAKYIKPEVGKVYHNRGGGEYRCIAPLEPLGRPNAAVMVNIKSGWTFAANGIQAYEDGTIEWDYSTGGHFEAVS